MPVSITRYTKIIFGMVFAVSVSLSAAAEENPDRFEKKEINLDIFEKYCEENKTEKGIKLIRRYYGIVAKK